MQALWGQLAAAYPDAAGKRAPAITGLSVLSPDSMETARTLSAVLVAAALLVLLIACANTANLLLAPATLAAPGSVDQNGSRCATVAAHRRVSAGNRDAVRRRRSVWLRPRRGGAALVFALRSDRAAFPERFPIAANLDPGALVAAFTLALIVGGEPVGRTRAGAIRLQAEPGECALGRSRPRRVPAELDPQHRSRGTGRGLHIGAGRDRSLPAKPAQPSRGGPRRSFTARKIAAAWIFLETNEISREQSVRLFDELRRGAAAIPGVESVAIASDLPLGGDSPDHDEIFFTDRPASSQKITAGYSVVDENYFAATRNPADRGPGFPLCGSRERRRGNRNQSSSWRRNSGRTRMRSCRTIRTIAKERRAATVVGIAVDGKYGDLDEPQQSYMYYSLGRHYQVGATLSRSHRGAEVRDCGSTPSAAHGAAIRHQAAPPSRDHGRLDEPDTYSYRA